MKVSVSKMPYCPECGSNWVSSAIPKDQRHNYTPPYFFSRINGCYSIETDRVEYYQCPDCKTEFPRFGSDIKMYEVDRSKYPT